VDVVLVDTVDVVDAVEVVTVDCVVVEVFIDDVVVGVEEEVV